jgi:hypothetical protein
MMPLNHVVLVPLVLVLGITLGWRLGSRQVRQEWERAERRRRAAEDAG